MGSNEPRPSVPRRKYVRLKQWDYASPGAYSVTICTENRTLWFGEINEGEVTLTKAGAIAEQQWLYLPQRFAGVQLDAHIVMPNHIHGVVVLDGSDESSVPLREVVRAFKAATSRLVRVHTRPEFGWQRGFYDRIVRNDRELEKVRLYIEGNPGQWELDRENPGRRASTTERLGK